MPPAATFLFAGGGTGGHIFPAIAIAEALTVIGSDAHARFLCSTRPLDTQILSAATLKAAHVDFSPIPASPFGLRPLTFARFASNWGKGVRAARAAIRAARLRGPVVVVAMGGFVAAPVTQAARVERVPILLVNLDAVPGKANRWIARHATAVVTAAPLAPSERRVSWQSIPPIVRASAKTTRTPAQCRAGFGLAPETRTLLVTGGSQGAGSINAFMQRLAGDPSSGLHGWQIIHQTGRSRDGTDWAGTLRSAYADASIPAWVGEFIDTMGDAWGAATLAISRAGAGSVAEAWTSCVPTLFLPYPYHRDQHQKHNARVLIDAGGAALLADHIDPDANARAHTPRLRALLVDTAPVDQMHAALRRLGPADGAERVAAALMNLAGTHPPVA